MNKVFSTAVNMVFGLVLLAGCQHVAKEPSVVDKIASVEASQTQTLVNIKDVFDAGLSVKNGSTSAGFVEFFEDSDNGTNKVTLVGPASTSDITITLPSSAGTLATTATAATTGKAIAMAIVFG